MIKAAKDKLLIGVIDLLNLIDTRDEDGYISIDKKDMTGAALDLLVDNSDRWTSIQVVGHPNQSAVMRLHLEKSQNCWVSICLVSAEDIDKALAKYAKA